MVFRSIFFSFLVAFFSTVATYTVTQVRTLISPTYAEVNQEAPEEEVEVVEEENSHSISLENVLVNNQNVELNEKGKIFVSQDDAVRISGKGNPNAEITVYYGDSQKTTKATENGYWFVLFSITHMEENQYLVTAKEVDSGEKSIPLITIVVGEGGEEIVEPLLDSSFHGIAEFIDSLPVYLILLISIPLAMVVGGILGITLKKKNRKK